MNMPSKTAAGAARTGSRAMLAMYHNAHARCFDVTLLPAKRVVIDARARSFQHDNERWREF